MATYYVDTALGADINAGTSEGSGNAWATIDKAMNTVAAGDKVWVKASGTYSEDALLDTPGDTTTGPIVFEGYTSTTGDNGQVTMSATTSCLAAGTISAGNYFYVFKNFKFTGGSSHAVNVLAGDNCTWVNCEFSGAGADGINADDYHKFYKCVFSGNTSEGANVDVQPVFICCRFTNNGGTTSQVNALAGTFLFCEFFGASVGGINFDGNVGPFIIINCTFDGEATASQNGIYFNHGTEVQGFVAINNILYDWNGSAVLADLNFGDLNLIGYNLINSNTTDYGTNISNTLGNDVTSAPTFTNEAGDVYTLGSGSPAVHVGTDGNDLP